MNAVRLNKRGFKARVDDVAGNVWQAPPTVTPAAATVPRTTALALTWWGVKRRRGDGVAYSEWRLYKRGRSLVGGTAVGRGLHSSTSQLNLSRV